MDDPKKTNETGDNAGVKFPPPLVYVGMLLLGFLLDEAWPEFRFAADPGLALSVALMLIAAGGILLFASLKLFRQEGNNPEPWKPVDTFIAQGVYLRTRNPMYLAMAFIYLAIAIYFQSLGALFLFVPLIVMIGQFVIAREEAYLERKFGQSYLDYKTKVRRWI